MDPKRFYKKGDSKLPKYFEVSRSICKIILKLSDWDGCGARIRVLHLKYLQVSVHVKVNYRSTYLLPLTYV